MWRERGFCPGAKNEQTDLRLIGARLLRLGCTWLDVQSGPEGCRGGLGTKYANRYPRPYQQGTCFLPTSTVGC